MAHRKRCGWRWRRSILSFVFVCTCWTLVGRRALCKPMLQGQGPPATSPDSRWQSDSDPWTTAERDAERDVPSSDTVARLDRLRETMETFKRLRLTLNERLLTSGAAKTRENFKFSGASPSAQSEGDGDADELSESRRRNFVLVAAMDEMEDASSRHLVLKRADAETDPDEPAKQRQRNQKDRQQQRRHRQRMRMLSRNQRRLGERRQSELERAMQDDAGASYQNQMQGLQVTANIQQSTGSVEALRLSQRQRQEERLFLASVVKSDYECPKLHGKATQVLCPSRRRGYRVCIPDTALCNGHVDCPLAEDEDPVNCLYYKTTIHHFRLIVDAVVELSDVVKKHENRHSMDEL